MKSNLFPLTMMALAMVISAGCEHQAENNPPALTNSAGDQPMPGVTASNDVTPPSMMESNAAPVLTHWPGTNNPSGTNQ